MSGRRRISKETRHQIAAVEGAGGSVRFTRDGHVVFLDRSGHMVGRSNATSNKSGRAARDITEAMVRRVGPPRPPTPRPVRPAGPMLNLAGPEPVIEPSPLPPEEVHVEKRILVCDACDAEGRSTGAVDTIKVESLASNRKARVDLCADHLDLAFSVGVVTTGGRKFPRQLVKNDATTNGHRFTNTMRCPLPGADGYEGPGQGMFQHFRHHHPEVDYQDHKDAARAAYLKAHPESAKVPA